MKLDFKHTIFIIFILFLGKSLTGQNLTYENIEKTTNNIVAELLNTNITNSVLVYTNGCVGCKIISSKDCECDMGFNKTYIIWKKLNTFKIQLIDCCKIHPKEEINFEETWNYLDKNAQNLFKSKYKTEFELSHYSFTNIKLISKKRILTSDINSYFFDESNKYRNKNIKQPMNGFNKIISLKIKEFEERQTE